MASNWGAVVRVLVAAALILFIDSALGDQIGGAWLSPVEDNWPLVQVHAALTPDGRVLTFGSDAAGQATGYFHYDVWDPEAGLSGGHVTIQNTTLVDIFCSYALIVPGSGRVLIAGGTNWTGSGIDKNGNSSSTLFDSSDDTLSRGNEMLRPRWYATATPLMNGDVYVQGGKGGADLPEVRDTSGAFRTLTGAPTATLDWWYAFNFLAPDGRVFGFDSKGHMYFVSTDGDGSRVPAGELGTTNVARFSSAAMYRPGKILLVTEKNKKVWNIDINGTQPIVSTAKRISAKRIWGNATVLADGRVLMTGGSGQANQLVDVTNHAEIWNPQTGTWTIGPAGSRPRLYHSMALLLPDASVLVGGGGANETAPLNNLHAEIYYPPYLFDASGGFAVRPQILGAPDTVAAGQSFQVQVDSSAIGRVTLIQAGAVTHGKNLQQRFSELSFSQQGDLLDVQMPQRATDVPPGYYLLFAFNTSGVPSKAKIVRINVTAGNPPPSDVTAPSKPTITSITKISGNPHLVWSASTDNVGVAGYAIYRSTNGTLGPEFARVGATILNWTDTNVIEGTKYTYGLKAYDAAGNFSSASGLKSKIAYALPTKPGSFAVKLVNNKPQLSFTPSTDNVGVVGYNVYRSTNGTMGALHAQIAGSPWSDTTATAGVTYTYAVRARDAADYLSNPTALKSITSQ